MNQANSVSGGVRMAPPPVGAVIWMERPAPMPGCPPGLEYLTHVDSLHAEQIPSLLEAFTGWDTNNKYVLKNGMGQQVFYAMEDTDSCMRACCGTQRGFTIYIVDNMNQQVMRIKRDFKCCAGCCWCAGCCNACSHELVVEAPIGTIIGYFRQRGSFWSPKYSLFDENHQEIFHIIGPCCILDGPFCPVDNKFKVMTLDEKTEIGAISKQYAGFVNEAFTTADHFGITFPKDLNVKQKATMIAGLFLIDFMFFENKQNNGHHNSSVYY